MQHFWFFDYKMISIGMSGKMKDSPGSGQIWTLILGVFRGEDEIFAASLASAVDSDCSRTAPG